MRDHPWMRYALGVPPDGEMADPARLVELAVEAERAGWDGWFIWDHLIRRKPWKPMVDAWVVLGAVAQATDRIAIGPMVTPLARRRPAMVARHTVTLDHLSGGRVVFGAGLGAPDDEFTRFGDEGDARIRGAQLDEALDVLTGLWSGEPYGHRGPHYVVDDVQFTPAPVNGRIPVWIAGRWPGRAPFVRGARFDGMFPVAVERGALLRPDEVAAIAAFIADHRDPAAGAFDIAVQQRSVGRGESATRSLADALADAGATWWVETLEPLPVPVDELLDLVRAGPPAWRPRSWEGE